MKVRIDRDREGWRYFVGEHGKPGYMMSKPVRTYYDAKALASTAGHEIDNAGWNRRLLMWNFNSHALDGYPGWEIERDRSPAFVKLAHTRGSGSVESHKLAATWDYVAEVDFYQRDWTNDGIPFVRDGDVYWSGWWFQTIAERDRFVRWHASLTTTTEPHHAD